MFAKLSQFSQSFKNHAGLSIKSVCTPDQSRIASTSEPLASNSSFFNFGCFMRETVCVFVYVIVRTVNNIGVFEYGTKLHSVTSLSSFKEITNSDVQSLHNADSIQSLNIDDVDDNDEVINETSYTAAEPETSMESQILHETLRKASSSTISSDEGIHSARGYEIDEIEELSEDFEEDEKEKEIEKPIYPSRSDLTQGEQKKLTLCFINKGFYAKLKRKLPHMRKDSKEPLPILYGQKLGRQDVPSDKTKTESSIWSRMIKVFHQNKVEHQPACIKSKSFLSEGK